MEDTVLSSKSSGKSQKSKEDPCVDLDAAISNTSFTLGSFLEIKACLQENPDVISQELSDSLLEVVVEPTYHFPEFMHWIANNFVKGST